jgi:hypothetical protein
VSFGPASGIPPGTSYGELAAAGVGGLLSEVLERYIADWKRLVGVAATIAVPAAVLQAYFTRDVSDVLAPGVPTDPGVPPTETELTAVATVAIVAVVVAAVVTPLITILLLRAGAEHDTDLRTETGDLYRIASAYFVPMLGLLVLFGIIVAIGFLALIVPGVYLAVRLYLATPVLVIEGETITGALARSWRLTRGATWRLLGAIVLTVIIVGAVSIGLALPAVMVSALLGPEAWLLEGIFSGAVNSVLWPLLMVLEVVLYIHRRAAVEGYAPEALAADLVASETRR